LHASLTTAFASRRQLICLLQGDVILHSEFLQISNFTIPYFTAKLLSIQPMACFAGCNVQLKGVFANASVFVLFDGVVHLPFLVKNDSIHFNLQHLSQTLSPISVVEQTPCIFPCNASLPPPLHFKSSNSLAAYSFISLNNSIPS